jgi:cobalamin biosynthesis protein CobC
VTDDLAAFTTHGGRVSAARARFGGTDWVDLSTGIAPWPYPAVADEAHRLPEPSEMADLEQAAGAAFGVLAGRELVAVPGTDLALRLLAILLSAERPAVLVPGYGGHRAAWPGALPWAGGDHDLLVLANPNNPDGRLLSRGNLLALAERLTLVVDEAYADAEPRHSVADAESERLVVLRSFGKFFGLPGLRLGFVIAAPALAQRLRALLGDWPVAQPALATGRVAYRDTAWQAMQRERVAVNGAWLDMLLDAAGLQTIGRTPFFRLIATADAHGLFRHLAGHAILTRPFTDMPDRLRIGLPADAAAGDRLAAALEDRA